MLQSIVEAAKNFCIHQLRCEPVENQDLMGAENIFVGEIEVTTSVGEKYNVYICATKEFIQEVANAMLFEEESDDETLVDMAMECTNLIVGSAKVIASSKNIDFNISTPNVLFKEKFEYEDIDTKVIVCDGKALLIAMKKI